MEEGLLDGSIAKEDDTSDEYSVLINGVLEISMCPDTGADNSIVPVNFVKTIQERCKDVKILPITNPPVVKAAGRKRLTCTSMVFLDLQIRAAAGPGNIHNVKCYVFEEGDDHFMLGRDVLEALGINIKSIWNNWPTQALN
ncbi:Aspartic peptidase domain [Plasmopara halstedii]|uniref:Aspartic peptidase domain n=1 Tax=Plasmopara halstedii TaxID=4781 RepID=A0A0P1A9V8_PLAHL|nr:Aspartic peptidase domain [Plasmopara halstedii]CEG37271.1 Aspartic peptidase domain [Plasmopara halstedii]|eukprot:XP_024573640.1 Aspartic peptidase domain [Plasmopara halstedii]